jgi:hypothetical protein
MSFSCLYDLKYSNMKYEMDAIQNMIYINNTHIIK